MRTATKAVGTKKGKSADGLHRLAGVWLPKDLLLDVKEKLVKAQNPEFSALVEKLLRAWVAK